MLSVSKTSDNFLSADYTNITACNTSQIDFQLNLLNIHSWLVSNKLTLKTDKTRLINFNNKS